MAPTKKSSTNTLEIDRLALQLVKDPHSKVFMPLAEEYVKAGMWQEAAAVLEDGLKHFPGFITAMVALGRAYDQIGQSTKAKAILEEAVKLSPENLRAHRTLVKIYVAQGLVDAALRCCTVILAVNPQDEEALSIQAQLGTPIPQRPPAKVPAAPIRAMRSVSEPPALPVSAPMSTEPTQPNVSVDPLTAATTRMETTLERIHRPSEEPVGQTIDPVVTTPASVPPASSNIVSQLETWLRTIQSRRRDRDQADRAYSGSS
jgi:tetratricopeptide (TPR) repeat protein